MNWQVVIVKIINSYLSSLFLLTISVSVQATTITAISIDQALAQSELVFEGIVTRKDSRINAKTGEIRTYVTFKITDFIKGKVSSPVIELSFLGGQVDNQVLKVGEMHLPRNGEKGIYFVESISTPQIHAFTGWSQGHFLVIKDQNGIERVTTWNSLPVKRLSRSTAGSVGTTSVNPQYAKGIEVLSEPSLLPQSLTLREFKQQILNYNTGN